MTISWRLFWFMTKEVVSLTLVVMAALSSIMFLFRLLAFADYIFISEEGLLSILMFVLFLLPAIFKLTVPISMLLSSTVVVLRMSGDRELEGWLSVGASPARIAVGPFVVGIFVCALSASSALLLEPYSRQEWKRFKYLNARKSIEAIIENRLQEKTFLSELFRTGDSDIAFYVDKLAPEKNSFEGVFLAVTRKNEPYSMVLLAKEGTLRKEDTGGLTDYVITLRDGRYYRPQATRGDDPLQASGAKVTAADGAAGPKSARADAAPSSRGWRLPNLAITPLPTPIPTYDLKEAAKATVLVGPTQPPQAYVATPRPTPVPIASVVPWSDRYTYPGEWSVMDFRELRVSLLNMFSGQFDPGGIDQTDIRSRYPRDYISELRKLRASPEWGHNPRQVRDHSYFYEQIIVPFACLVLPIIGVCLGIQDPRRKAGLAYLGLGLVVFAYYASIMMCQQLAARFLVPPEISLVVPPVIIVVIAVVLLRWRMRFPPSVQFLEYLRIVLGETFGALRRLLGGGGPKGPAATTPSDGGDR